jgi:hypothetical protein
MKKLFFLFFIVFTFSSAYSQVKIGVQVSPIFTVNRITSFSDSLALNPNGARLRMMAGPIFDFFLKENYYFSTGLLYAPKVVGFDASINKSNVEFEETYISQYIRVPLTFRLYTNEISLDNRIYVQFGLTADINIHEEAKSSDNFLVQDFTLVDGTAVIGLGLEHRIGYQTTIFGGFSYSRGLVNTVSDHVNLDDDIKSRNDIFAIDFGIFF